MFGNHFYNETTRRYVAVFGTLFNDIIIRRYDNNNVLKLSQKVPINYAPMQKLLARLEADPDLRSPAITLPRMSFEITGMTYNAERKIGGMQKYVRGSPTSDNSLSTQYTPSPYDIEFQLNIMTKYNEDGTKILEQILPYFQPEYTPTVKILDDMELFLDVPIVLNGVTVEDIYEGNFEERRSQIWTLNFTMKAFYFGPTAARKVIKFSQATIYSPMDATQAEERINVRPGLTANGTPTTSVDDSVDYTDISIDDDWAFIVQVEDL
jgi:hypothetical protein